MDLRIDGGRVLAGGRLEATSLHVAADGGRITSLGSEAAAARTLDRMDPPMRTFIALDEGDVRRQAEAAAKRRGKGAPLSPLDGDGDAVER